jgi:hypothetical protein
LINGILRDMGTAKRVIGNTNFRFSGATISLVRAFTRESGVSAEWACDDVDFFDFGRSISEVGEEEIDDNGTEIGAGERIIF